MELDVVISASQVTEEQVVGRTVCVIDVFRATSVMVTALGNGAVRILPLGEVEGAFRLRDDLAPGEEKILLGGERGTVLIPGFDLDNSPQAYTPERVAGATILFTTTNGTRAIRACGQARRILIGAFINASAACRAMIAAGDDITLVCSGREGHYTMEDALCAGLMAEKLSAASPELRLTDLAWTLREQYRTFRSDLRYPLSQSRHYNFILGRGLHDDIDYCLQESITETVPFVNGQGELVI